MKTKKLTRDSIPAETTSPEKRNAPVVSGSTPVNIGSPRNQQQENNTKTQAPKQEKPSVIDHSKPTPPQRVPGRFQSGNSGNPKGRPKNSPNKATQAARDILDGSAQQLLAKAVELALAGNPTALKLCFDRIAPQRRRVHLARLAKLTTQTKETESVLSAHNAVLEAVASGEITPQEGQSVSAIVDARRRSWESMQIEEQISNLQDCADDVRTKRRPKIVWTDSPRKSNPDDNAQGTDHDDPKQPNGDVA